MGVSRTPSAKKTTSVGPVSLHRWGVGPTALGRDDLAQTTCLPILEILMDRRSDSFFDVPKTVVSISSGSVELPARYFDASNYLALFQVDVDNAAEKLRSLPVQPVLVSRKAMAVLTFFKFRDSTLGPYYEVGLAILATLDSEPQTKISFGDLLEPSCRESLASWVLDLPVTSPLGCAAGCEVWGYPKFVAQLSIELNGDGFRSRVVDTDGKLIMEMAGERGYVLSDEIPGMAPQTYSMRNGQLLRTTVATRSRCQTSGGGSIRISVGDSQHRMAKNLQDLGLDGKMPKVIQTSDDFQSILFAGEPV